MGNASPHSARKKLRENIPARSAKSSTRDITFWVLALLFFALPVVILPGWFIGHDVTPKLLTIIFACCLALVTVQEWVPGLIFLSRQRIGKIYCGLLGLSVISVVLSTTSSVHVALSLAGTSWRRLGAVPQIEVLLLSAVSAGYAARFPQRIQGVLKALVAGGTCAAIYGICQYFGWDPILDSNLYTFGDVIRPPAALGHAMYLATFLLPAAFVALAWTFLTEKQSLRVLLLAICGICIVAIVLSGTRSAILGLAAGILCMFFCRRSKLGYRGLRIIGILAMVLLVLLLGIYYSGAGGSLRSRVTQWGRDAKGGPRLLVWRDSLTLIRERPLLGHGPETFAEEFRRIESPTLANLYPDYFHESPHNLFVDVAVNQGILGLLVTLGLLGFAAFTSLWNNGDGSGLGSGLLSGFVAVMVALQFIPLTLPVAVLLYFMAGILVALRFPMQETIQINLRPVHTVALVIAGVLLATSGMLYAVQDLGFVSLGRDLAQKNLARISDAYESLARLPFPKPGYDLWFSRQLASVALSASGEDFKRALTLARQASEVAERTSEEPFNASYQSAALAIAANDAESAEKKLRALIEKAPTWYKPRRLLVQLLILSGRVNEGLTQTATAADVAGEHRQEVMDSIKRLMEQSNIIPSISSGGIVNGAGFLRGTMVPGSVAEISGTNLSAGEMSATSFPLPTTMGGTIVEMNGSSVPLIYVSPSLIKFQVPWELAALKQASLTVSLAGAPSLPILVNLATVGPGMFLAGQNGIQGAILISATGEVAAARGSVGGRPARPVRRGESISIYCTGLGPVTNAPATGIKPLPGVLSVTTAVPIVTIGRSRAQVMFSGLAPDGVGLYQVNAIVKDGTEIGPAVPVVLTVEGVNSNRVILAIQ